MLKSSGVEKEIFKCQYEDSPQAGWQPAAGQTDTEGQRIHRLTGDGERWRQGVRSKLGMWDIAYFEAEDVSGNAGQRQGGARCSLSQMDLNVVCVDTKVMDHRR